MFQSCCRLCPCDSSLKLENPTHFYLLPQTSPSSGLPRLYFLCPIVPWAALAGFIHARTHASSPTSHFGPFTPLCLGQRPCLHSVGAAETDEGRSWRRSSINLRRALTLFFPEYSVSRRSSEKAGKRAVSSHLHGGHQAEPRTQSFLRSYVLLMAFLLGHSN